MYCTKSQLNLSTSGVSSCERPTDGAMLRGGGALRSSSRTYKLPSVNLQRPSDGAPALPAVAGTLRLWVG